MNKKWFLWALLAYGFHSFSQLNKGAIDVRLGFGIKPTFLCTPASAYPNNVSVEYRISDRLSAGAFVSRIGSSLTYDVQRWYDLPNGGGFYLHYRDFYRWSFFITGVKACYHLAQNYRYDFYVGTIAGNMHVRTDYQTLNVFIPPVRYHPAEYKSGFIGSVLAGCRMSLDEHAGVFAELGYGITYCNLGIAYKI